MLGLLPINFHHAEVYMTLKTTELAKVVTDAVKQIVNSSKINRNVRETKEINEIVDKMFGYIDYFNNEISIHQSLINGIALEDIEFPKALMPFIEPRAIVKDVTMLEMCVDLKIHHFYSEPAKRIKEFSITDYYDSVKNFLKLFNKWVDDECCGSVSQSLSPVSYSEISKRAVWVKISDCQELLENSCTGSAISIMDETIPLFVDSRIEFGFDEMYYSSYMNSYSDVLKSVSLYLNRKLASVLLAKN